MYKKKLIVVLLIVLICILTCAVSLFYISKSRDFQFFGRIITSVPNDDKRIALTFDDGPTEHTSEILEKLGELNISATFFLCGNDIEKRPEDVKKIVSLNHGIGNHSYSHQRMVLKSYDFYIDEVEKTNQLIQQCGYSEEIYFRPPYGKKLFGLPYYLNKAGITTIMWSMEPETVLGFDASADEIAGYIIENVTGGSIILLHPMYNPENVLGALDIAVPKLKERGYSFVTVDELLGEL